MNSWVYREYIYRMDIDEYISRMNVENTYISLSDSNKQSVLKVPLGYRELILVFKKEIPQIQAVECRR